MSRCHVTVSTLLNRIPEERRKSARYNVTCIYLLQYALFNKVRLPNSLRRLGLAGIKSQFSHLVLTRPFARQKEPYGALLKLQLNSDYVVMHRLYRSLFFFFVVVVVCVFSKSIFLFSWRCSLPCYLNTGRDADVQCSRVAFWFRKISSRCMGYDNTLDSNCALWARLFV